MDFYLLENTNSCSIKKLRDEDGNLVSGATFQLTIVEYIRETDSYVPIAGPSWPLVFTALGRGDYRVNLPNDLPLELGKEYKSIIEGFFDGRVFFESRSLFAKKRLTR